jgi:hypothetical protein
MILYSLASFKNGCARSADGSVFALLKLLKYFYEKIKTLNIGLLRLSLEMAGRQ